MIDSVTSRFVPQHAYNDTSNGLPKTRSFVVVNQKRAVKNDS